MTLSSSAVAYVSFIEGEVKARDGKGQIRILQLNDPIHEGDVVITGQFSTVVIALADDTTLTLGERQVLAVDEQVITSSPDPSAASVTTLEASEAETVVKILGVEADRELAERSFDSSPGEDPGSGPNFVNLLRIVEAVPVAAYEFPTNPTGTPPVIEGFAGGVPTELYVQRAEDSVYEAGLPQGSQSGGSSTVVGTIDFTAVHGLSAVSMVGHVLTTTPQSFDGLFGELTAWYSYDPVAGTGSISYRYTLTGTTSGDNTADSFSVVLSDALGNTTTNSLTINIVDDVPKAVADINSVTEDTLLAATGNVIGNDEFGADRVAGGEYVTGVTTGTVAADTEVIGGVGSTPVDGAYGQLVLDAKGAYTYELYSESQNASAYKAVQGLDAGETLTDTFSYTMKDADGDLSTTTLTITVNGSNDKPTVVIGADGVGDSVNESGLLTGSSPSETGRAVAGHFTVADADGLDDLKSITLSGTGGTGITLHLGAGTDTPTYKYFTELSGMIGSTFTTANGTVELTSYAAGVFGYTFTLTSPTTDLKNPDGTDKPESNSFTVTVFDGTDSSDPASVSIAIVDDVPVAKDDTDSLASAQTAPETGNVVTGAGTAGGTSGPGVDVLGADGATVTGIASVNVPGNTSTGTGTLTISGQYGMLTIGADGGYSYQLNQGTPGGVVDTFTYTLTDGDGDARTANLAIDILDMTPKAGVVPELDGVVQEDGTIAVTVTADVASTTDVINDALTGVTVTLPTDWSATATIDGTPTTYSGTFTLSASGTSFSQVLNVTPGPANTDVDGEITAVAHVKDQGKSVEADSAPTSATVVVDTVLDRALELLDGRSNITVDPNATQRLGLRVGAFDFNPYQQPPSVADDSESGTVTITLSSPLPKDVKLFRLENNIMVELLPVVGTNDLVYERTFKSNEFADAIARVNALSVEVPKGFEGIIEGRLSARFHDAPSGDGNPPSANDAYTSLASFRAIFSNHAWTGTSADDLYRGQVSDEILQGGAGKDTIEGFKGNDLIYGDTGNDWLFGGAGNDTLVGGDGRDTFIFELADISDQTATDTVKDFGVGDTLKIDALLQKGTLAASSDGSSTTLSITDSATGLSETIVLENYPTSDTQRASILDILVKAGQYDYGYDNVDDYLVGSDTSDTLAGGDADNVLIGRNGDDSLSGAKGNDLLYGGTGKDTLNGGEGNDTLSGGEGNDVLTGENGDDMLMGDGGADSLSGSQGNDSLWGGDGTDSLSGGNDNDLLMGEEGDDVLMGDDGADSLSGGQGNDELTGGTGSDIFVFRLADAGTSTAPATDRITDFSSGDTLQLNDLLSTGNTISAAIRGSDTLLHVNNSAGTEIQTIELLGYTVADTTTMIGSLNSTHSYTAG